MAAQSLAELTEKVRRFAADREWDQFHSPKNLAAALIVEAAEVLEHFQWLTEAESETLDIERRKQVALELADVLIYLVRLADRLDVDLIAATSEKLVLNAQKYPIDRARGSNKKYSDL